MQDYKEKIDTFKVKYKNKCFALAQWKNLKMKDFGMNEMLKCICNAANGSIQEMANIIDHLTSKNKVQGRTQVYAGQNVVTTDLVRNENGELELRGYNPEAELPLKGQHQKRNPKIFRKGDGEVNKNFQKAEDRMMNLGQKVRELYPNQDKQYIIFAMDAIRKYAEQKKIHTDKVIKGLEKGRYILDDDLWRIIPKAVRENKQRHTIVINESDMERIIDMIEMTEQKFHANMRRFISMLLQDPVNAKVPPIFAQRNYTRSSLLNYLLSGKDPILIRDQKICDTDENGEPKTATMIVKFRCPKKNFDRKLEKLYMRMFEKNLPPKRETQPQINVILADDNIDEATAGGCPPSGDGAGQIITTVFSEPISRQIYKHLEETATTDVGDYTYASPGGLGDGPTRERQNGIGGSSSVYIVDEEEKS